MKKKLTIAITVLYALLVVGVGMSTHYCMGFAQSPELFSFENEGCLCDGLMEEEHGCCEDEVEVVQIDLDQTVTSFNLDLQPAYFVLYSFELPELIEEEQAGHPIYQLANKPPPKEKVPVLFCSLTYYG